MGQPTVWLTDTPTLDSLVPTTLVPTLLPTELLLPTPDTVWQLLSPQLLSTLLPLLLLSPPLTTESLSPTVSAFLRLPPTLSLPSGLWLRLPSSSSGDTRSLTKRSPY